MGISWRKARWLAGSSVAALLAVALMLGGVPPSIGAQQCSISFALDPSSGTASPGGIAQFKVIGRSAATCPALVFQPSFQPTAYFAMSFNPPEVLIPPGGEGASQATVRVAPSAPAAVYELTVRVGVFTAEGQPVGVQELIFTLRVSGGEGPPGRLTAELTVDRGCGASYRIGDPIVISFRISRDAAVTLKVRMPEGSERVLLSGPVRGGRIYTLQGTVGEPPGPRLLTLEARAGEQQVWAECEFTGVREGITTTAIVSQIHTDRGCLEEGQSPVYYLGEPIRVTFRVDGVVQALVTIEDILSEPDPEKRVQVIFHQVVSGNRTLQLVSRIKPPTGLERLRLTAQADGFSETAECSFFVQQQAPKPRVEVPVKVFCLKGTKFAADQKPCQAGEADEDAKNEIAKDIEEANKIFAKNVGKCCPRLVLTWDKELIIVDEFPIKEARSQADDFVNLGFSGIDHRDAGFLTIVYGKFATIFDGFNIPSYYWEGNESVKENTVGIIKQAVEMIKGAAREEAKEKWIKLIKSFARHPAIGLHPGRSRATLAHEVGHYFGLSHNALSNDCKERKGTPISKENLMHSPANERSGSNLTKCQCVY